MILETMLKKRAHFSPKLCSILVAIDGKKRKGNGEFRLTSYCNNSRRLSYL